MRRRRVLHVLPHPGGGGETYVDTLEAMDGHVFARAYLAREPRPSGALAGGVWNALREARRHDLVHAHGEVAAGLCLPALVLRPSVVTLHGSHLLHRTRGIRRLAAVANLRALLQAADRAICVAQAEHRDLEGAVGHAAARKAVVIRNGVELPPLPTAAERDLLRAKLGLPPGRVLGIWIGSLDERKDPLTPALAALEAARSGLPLTLLMVGDGPLHNETARLEAADEVVILGFRTDVAQLLAASDFFVASSLHEGFSYALLEAMAAGLPPVVSRIPAHEEAAGDAALTAACGSVANFADAFARLVIDGEERARLGEAARRRVERSFSVEQMIEGTHAVYESVLAGGAS